METKFKKQAEVIPLASLDNKDVSLVGGKCASLGEMISGLSSAGIRVPGGFSTTARAFYRFLDHNSLRARIKERLCAVDVQNQMELAKAGSEIRGWIMEGQFTAGFVESVRSELKALRATGARLVAVRSSATAEDLPDASFAGQQDTLLGVPASLEPVLAAIKQVIASLFGDRAIAYRQKNGYEHDKVALCACVQRMVRSDRSVAGVMFSVCENTGNPAVVGITAVYGLGENAVGGSNADEYLVGHKTSPTGPMPVLSRRKGDMHEKMVLIAHEGHDRKGHFTQAVSTTPEERSKFCLTTAQLEELARFAMIIQDHYGRPMDMEWARDGYDGKMYIVQARPVTVNRDVGKFNETFILSAGDHKKVASGLAVGRRIASGRARILTSSSPEELAKVRDGDIIVARMTDPNYVPAMAICGGIVTEEGSSKCHAAIIAREMKKPGVVAVKDALNLIKDGDFITVCCSQGSEGVVFQDEVEFKVRRTKIGKLKEIPTHLKMNVGNPSEALAAALIPNHGVGLARQEFIINNEIGIHPKACIEYDAGTLDDETRTKVQHKIAGYKSAREFYVQKLTEGIGLIARAFHPQRVIIRLSDFKTNEYKDLIGGHRYEKTESNPMIGYRGAARYSNPEFKQCFDMECRALATVRGTMALTNVDIMVPFVRTVAEGRKVIGLLSKHGLQSTLGEQGLRVGMMVELPSNVELPEFAEIFDFGSIGSNDLTQLCLGIDRDAGNTDWGDERDAAVKSMIKRAVGMWKSVGKPIGICGQAPSDYPGYAEWLAEIGITSISLNTDSVIPVHRRLEKLLAPAVAAAPAAAS